MHFFKIVLALPVAGSVFAARSPIVKGGDETVVPTEPTEKELQTVDKPKRFIVEFAEGTDATAAAAELASSAGSTVLKVFNSGVFTGAAVLAEKENLDSLRAYAPVVRAWHSTRVMLEPGTELKSFSQDATAVNYSIHGMTGVDKLHSQGILGKGVTVAVVDTGVDYTHPALGGGIGPAFKVVGGYDFVGDGSWPDEGDKAPDADPLDADGHGTHVSGIIAGKSGFFTGVAPEAKILSYKVFSTASSTDEDTLIDAFLMAFEDGADVITSSISEVNGWTDSAWALVSSRLVDQGVVVTISAGNDGQGGAFAAGSGSSGAYVLAIASVEADIVAAPSFIGIFNLDGFSNATHLAYLSSADWYPSDVKDWPVYPLGLNTSIADEACSPLPAGTADLSGKVVLVRRGTCPVVQKQLNLAAFNASHILVYNDESPIAVPGQTAAVPLIASITSEAGIAIIETIKAGGNVTVDFTAPPDQQFVSVENGFSGGKASYFTSIGPTNDLFIKSDVAAPGGRILSTYLRGGYAVLSGSSMACPYVAGVAALYISKHGGRAIHGAGFAKNLAMKIIASGEAIPWNDGTEAETDYGLFASVAQVGTGLINATKVLDFVTSLSFSHFTLNDTVNFIRHHRVDIVNTGSMPVTYTFEIQDFGVMETYDNDPADWGTPRMAGLEELIYTPTKFVPTVSFPEGTFTVQPGQTKTAQFSFSPPKGLNATNLPIYSGKILIKGSNRETLGVPYLGLASDLSRDLGMMFQYPIGLPTLTSTVDAISINTKRNFTFDLSLDKQDFPLLFTRMNFATTELRWDIFDASWVERDWRYPPVVGKAGYVGSATTWSGVYDNTVFDPAIHNASEVVALPLSDIPRDIPGQYGNELWWLGQLSNGTQIAPGKYKMRFAALVPFGRPERADNWDVFPTPEFEVLKL